jgi:hypothetical protein
MAMQIALTSRPRNPFPRTLSRAQRPNSASAQGSRPSISSFEIEKEAVLTVILSRAEKIPDGALAVTVWFWNISVDEDVESGAGGAGGRRVIVEEYIKGVKS